MSRTRRAVLAALAAAVMGMAAAGEAAAQGMLSGRVLDDSTGEAIGQAQVALLSHDRRVLRRVVADEQGSFSFPIREFGGYRLRASRVGFREVVTPMMNLSRNDSLGVEVRMTTGRVLLAPLQVVSQPVRRHRAPGLDEFRRRLAADNGGTFITRDDVRQRQPFRLTDLLPQAGITVQGRTLYFNRSLCPPMVYVDGVAVTRYIADRGRRRPGGDTPVQEPYEQINSVAPNDVEGMELYAGMGSMPAEFAGPTARCGVIAIWTRRSEPEGAVPVRTEADPRP